jgi:hypothetical protein
MWVKRLEDSPKSAEDVRYALVNRQGSPNLAAMREKEALAKLPEDEARQWQKFWTDVADTLAKVQGKKAPEQKPGVK